MDTSALKPFAQRMRTTLMDGVANRLRYWGFADGPEPTHTVEPIEGGYLFRNTPGNDPTVPKKWRALKKAVRNHGVEAVQEAAAATWFNRLMALRILEMNSYESTVLGYAPDTQEPRLLYNARQGIVPYGTDRQKKQVEAALQEPDDNAAFRTLLLAYYAEHTLLNDVFGRLSDYTELLLPANLLDQDGPIDQLVTTEAIADDDYAQVELIGWLYQFYISEKKDAVYDKSGKFEPEDIPAATQIFTPNWIVRYLVENTIGKQWLQAEPDSPLRDDMAYLVQGDTQAAPSSNDASSPQSDTAAVEASDAPATVDFQNLQALQLFDPAAGSGHILVEGFDLLMAMYRERGYTDRQAVAHILTDNLKGLDIDRRAAQLARFALLMKAAEYDPRVLQRDVRPQVYPMPEPRSFSDPDLRTYFDDAVFEAHGESIKNALALLVEHGQNVGSALQFDLSDDARTAIAREVTHWESKTDGEAITKLTDQELVHELNAYLKPILLMTSAYPAVVMNPPYMGSRQMNGDLKSYLKKHYPASKRDLYAVFMEVGEENTQRAGRLAMINQQSWMFLSSYEDLRAHVLETTHIDSMLHLGPNTFDEISGEVVNSTAFALRRSAPQGHTGTYFRLVDEGDSTAKRDAFRAGEHRHAGVDQRDFEKIPGAPIAYWASKAALDSFSNDVPLGRIAETRVGLDTGDNKKYLREWYEINDNNFHKKAASKEEVFDSKSRWVPHVKGGPYKKWFGNLSNVISFDQQSFDSLAKSGNKLPSRQFYFKEGWSWSRIGTGNFSVRQTPSGCIFNSASPTGFSSLDSYLIAFLNTKLSDYFIRMINPTINFHVGTIDEIPAKITGECREHIDKLSESCQALSREDWHSRETSWDFTQPPLIHQNAPTLDAAYTAWQEQATDDFLQLHANEEELNEIFIDLYGLQDELSPRVALGDITILEDELDWDAVDALDAERDRLSDDELRARFLEDDPDEALFKMEVPIRQLLSYGIGVMLGRYRLSRQPSGLHIAHPEPSADELAPYEVPTPLCGSEPEGTTRFEIDDDGIVPLMGPDSPFSDDATYRMREILRLIWGEDEETHSMNVINRALSIGRSRGLKRDYEKTMDEWLVNDFYDDYHKKQYSVPYYGKKPIYWLFQSPKGHFQVLAYMHRMTKFTAQEVRRQYLHTYQDHLGSAIDALEAIPESERTADDVKQLDRLHEKAADATAYDEILKDVANQQIEIDLDDGVQHNYPKFGKALADL